MRFRLATRGSPLALLQARTVAALLEDIWPHLQCEEVVVTTRGDRIRDVATDDIPGPPGVFTKEAQDVVLAGAADAAVHSAKDLPTTTPEGLVIAAVPERYDPRDALVGGSLESLPEAAVVATDSPRRRAQLLAARPDLRFRLLRGNIGTRLQKLDEGEADAIVMAMAALLRLGIDRGDVHPLDPAIVLPAQGQGALAVETAADGPARELVDRIDVPFLSDALHGERAAVRTLEGGCRSATAALAENRWIDVAMADGEGGGIRRARGRLADAESVARTLLGASEPST